MTADTGALTGRTIGHYAVGAALGQGGMGIVYRARDGHLVHGGYRMSPYEPPVDPFDFTPRVTIPTLMLSGEYDSTFPVEASQMPMFDQLGTPAADKKRIAFKIGHEFLPTEFAKETLAWLDRYLGEVNPR